MKGKQQQNGFEVLKAKSVCCTCDCPIIVDTSGNGFELTSAANGVRFDMSGTASPVQMSWTGPGEISVGTDSGNLAARSQDHGRHDSPEYPASLRNLPEEIHLATRLGREILVTTSAFRVTGML